MVHFRRQGLAETVRPFAEDCEMGAFGVGDEMLTDPGEGLIPQFQVDGLLLRRLEVLFDEVFCHC